MEAQTHSKPEELFTDVKDVGEGEVARQKWGQETKRGLKGRHLSMLAVGGTIGTGLFLISGSTISTAGPVGAVIAFIIAGIFVYLVVSTIGELATVFPISGSFAAFSDRFFDPALGFAQGYAYWFLWVLTLPAELSSAGIIISYWAPDIGTWVWALVFLVMIVVINLFGVKYFGEAEFFFSFLKVLVVVVFILVGLILNGGGISGHPARGFQYWKSSTPGAPFADGWPGVLSALVTAFLSYGGTELVGLTAGEAKNPRRDVPRAIKGTIGRILLCYVGSIFVISINIPSTDSSLLSTSAKKIAVSPFTLVFKDAGIAAAASIMNAAILIAVVSAGNTSVYASSRILFALAKNGQAPKLFTYTWGWNGTPIAAMVISVAVGFVAFLGDIFGQGVVFTWLYNLIAICNLLIYMSQCLVHIRFRKGWIKQGNDPKDLPYKAAGYPYTSIFAFLMGCLIVAGEGYVAATTRPFAWANIVATYVGVPFFFVLYILWKVIKKTKMIPYEDMDFLTGRSYPPTDEEIANLNERKQMDMRPWKELSAKGKAIKAGRTAWRTVF
ncbi:putative lysine-specific permease protein [Coleophoma cylindrospora]|uniref:Putative lysine-specific permease protein n=1 Tax=Coleophoma cylindrospora TaxID=1849047 RepID=A0A3D8S1T6_9HELO|nr:putative lysine-specific permease protein [Coleophoma cylindrospora]